MTAHKDRQNFHSQKEGQKLGAPKKSTFYCLTSRGRQSWLQKDCKWVSVIELTPGVKALVGLNHTRGKRGHRKVNIHPPPPNYPLPSHHSRVNRKEGTGSPQNKRDWISRPRFLADVRVLVVLLTNGGTASRWGQRCGGGGSTRQHLLTSVGSETSSSSVRCRDVRGK